MRNFIIVSIGLIALLNFTFFILFFNMADHVMKLLFSEISIFISGGLALYIAKSSSHDAIRISSLVLFFFIGILEVCMSYFIASNLKFNVPLFIWILLVTGQVLILAVSFLIKPRP
jgi:hypothetical protein